MPKDLAIVLNDGSIASAVATSLAVQRYRPILLHAETVAQGASRVRAAYDQQVAHYKPYREHPIAIPWAMSLAQPAPADARLAGPIQQRLTALLPLIAIAGRFAAYYDTAAIYVGLRIGPQADDLTVATEYLQIWNEMLQLPCGQPELEIHAPLLELDPWQVVDLAFQVNAPLELTWSCLGEAAEPCGTCRGCRSREQAFQQAGKPDPLRTVRR